MGLSFDDVRSALTGSPDRGQVGAALGTLRQGAPNRPDYQIPGGAQTNANNANLSNRLNNQNYNSGLAGQAQGSQQGALSLYQNAALGNGPSAAVAASNQQLGNINNQLQSAAYGQQGVGGAGLTQRNLLNAQTAASNNAQAGLGAARAQEQLGAMQGYANQSDALRSSDTNQANSAFQASAQTNQQIAGLNKDQYGQNVDQANANMQFDSNRMGNLTQQAQLQMGSAIATGQGNAALGKSISDSTSAGGSAALSSDMNAKSVTLQPAQANTATNQFLQALSSLGDAKQQQQQYPNAFARQLGGKLGGKFRNLFADQAPPPGGGAVAAAPADGLGGGLDAGAGAAGAGEAAAGAGAGAAEGGAALGAGAAEGAGAGAAAGGEALLALAPLAAASDRKLKEGVTAGSAKVDSFMDNLKPYGYRYKDPEAHGQGERLGIMAQDAQKSEMGRGMVHRGPDGLMIDVNKGLSAALASVAHLNKRIDELESRRAHG